jgi:hypothetical protein
MTRRAQAFALLFLLTLATVVGCADRSRQAIPAGSSHTSDLVQYSPPPAAVVAAAQRLYQSGSVSGVVEWTLTTTQKAASVTQAQPGTRDIPIYVIQARGQFRLDNVPRPHGAKSPEGTVLLTFFPLEGDPPEGASGLQLSSTATDLSPFGEVNTFNPPAPRRS